MNHMTASYFPGWMGEYPRQNSPWTDEELKELYKCYREGTRVEILAAKHGRTNGGILSRLEQMFPELREVREANTELVNIHKEFVNIQKEFDKLIERAEAAKRKINSRM